MSEAPPPTPIEALPLHYGLSSYGRRPTVITLIGVTSIVLGCLSLLLNGGLVLQTLSLYERTRNARTNVSQPSLNFLPPESLELPQRRAVVDGLTHLRPLTPNQIRQLDLLLAIDGKEFIRIPPPAITPRAVSANVVKSSPLTATAGEKGDAFDFAYGSLQLTDTRASFVPNDPREQRLESKAPGQILAMMNGNYPLYILAIVARAQERSTGTLANAQLTALATMLRSPNQSSIRSPDQVQATNILPDGTAKIFFDISAVTIDPSGKIVGWTTYPSSASFRKPTLYIAPAVVGITEGLLAAALAIYLFISGMRIFRDSMSAGYHHWTYAWMKLVLSICAAIAWAWIWRTFIETLFTGNANATPARDASLAAVTFAGLLLGLAGTIYPITLLFLLRSKTVKDYYTWK